MDSVIKNYNLQIKKFQKIEMDSSENEIHDKRVILRRIFPILAAYKIKPSKVKNGEKAFKLFGKLRDVQVQVLKLESIGKTPEIIEYLAFLKEKESELKDVVRRFFKKKELEFPTIKKKSTLNKSKIVRKTDKSLNKLIERIQSRSIDDAEDIHKIRIEFKKFRYKVEILSYLENIDPSALDNLKNYQDRLGEIQDYEVLISGIKKYCKKRNQDDIEMITQFEQDQNTLIENFDNQIELFIAACKKVLVYRKVVEGSSDISTLSEKSAINAIQTDITNNVDSSSGNQVSKIIDSLIANTKKEKEKNTETNPDNNIIIESDKKEVVVPNKVGKRRYSDTKKENKSNLKSQPLIENAVSSNSDSDQTI